LQTQHKQTEQLGRYEKQLSTRYLRARRLYDEGKARLAKSQGEMQTAQVTSPNGGYDRLTVESQPDRVGSCFRASPAQESVHRATLELARLQAARTEQASALKAANARITDNSRLLERKRQVRHLMDENRELGLKLQVLHDYWTRKQQLATRCGRINS
jgi:hypothetical protein